MSTQEKRDTLSAGDEISLAIRVANGIVKHRPVTILEVKRAGARVREKGGEVRVVTFSEMDFSTHRPKKPVVETKRYPPTMPEPRAVVEAPKPAPAPVIHLPTPVPPKAEPATSNAFADFETLAEMAKGVESGIAVELALLRSSRLAIIAEIEAAQREVEVIEGKIRDADSKLTTVRQLSRGKS